MVSGPISSLGRWFSLAALALAGGSAAAQVITWSGTGDWSSAANWSSSSVPTAVSNVQVSTGAVTLSDTRAVNQATFSGGTLTGAGTLNIGGLLTWSGTTLSGSGSINANAGLSLTNNVSLYGGQILTLTGSSTWSGGTLYHGAGATLNNLGTFTLTSNDSMNFYYGGARTVFNNSGTFTKNGGSGSSTVDAVVNNTGTLAVQSGSLTLSGGGSNSGTIGVASESTLSLTSGTFTLNAGSTLKGSGTLQIAGATATLGGAINGGGNVTLSSGVLNGAGTLNGQLTLSGGEISGAGVLNANGGVNITNNVSIYNGRTVNFSGNSTWSGGTLYQGTGAILNNLGSFTLTSNASMSFYYGGARAIFNNSGTLVKTSNEGTSTLDAIFNNTGRVFVQTGTLNLSAGGTNSGTINVASGATLALTGGTFTLNAGSFLNGNGTVQVAGATATFTGTTAGSANFNLTSGVVNGTGTLTGVLGLSGGEISGAGTLTANVGASITNNVSLYNGHTLTLNGNSTWSGGTLFHGTGALLNNLGTLTLTSNDSMNYYYGGTRTVFTNAGTFVKDGGTGNSTLDAVVNNTGTLAVQTGSLTLSGGGANSGVFSAAAGSAINLTSGTFTLNGGSAFVGSGTTTIAGATATLAGTTGGTGAFSLTSGVINGTGSINGKLFVSGGEIGGSGTLTVNGGLAITNNFSLDNSRTLNLSGNSTWSGGTLLQGTGAILNNSGAFTLTSNDGTNFYYGGTRGVFNNSGSFTKATATGNSTLDLAFNNTGVVNVQTGTLTLTGGGSNSGAFNVSAGATLALGSGTFTLNAGSMLNSFGTIQVSGATATLAGAINGTSALSLTGGVINGTGSLNGRLLVSGGEIGGSGTLTANGGVTITNSFNLDNNRTLNVSGNSTWSGGTLYQGTGAILNNSGNFTLTSNDATNFYFGGTRGVLNNSGTFTKTAGTGTSTIDLAVTNTGTVRADTGTLSFTSTFTNTGGSLLANGGTLAFSNALSVPSGKLGGAGTVSASTVTVGGTLAPGNPLGLLTVAGNLTLSSGATSQFTIAGATRGTQYSAVDVTGAGNLTTLAGSLQLSFTNAGYAVVQPSDTFTLLNSPTTITGAFSNIASGSRLTTADGTGSFQVNISGTTVTLSQFLLDASTRLWAGGDLNTLGNVTPSLLTASTVPTGTHLAIYTDADHDFSGITITNNGTIDWVGGRLRSGFGGAIANAGVWNDSASAEFNNDFQSTVWTFNNTGTYNKTAGTTVAKVPFNNAGTVNVTGGTLQLDAGGTISSGANYTGAGQTLLHSGAFATSGTFTSANLVLSGDATLTGSSTLDGLFRWTSGNFNTGGTTTIPSTGTLLLSTSADHDFSSHAFVNNGTINWTNGRLRSGFGGSITNNATFNDTASSEFNNDYQSTVWTFTNAASGTYFKTGDGTTNVNIPFNNTGTVTVNGGTLLLNAGGTISAGALYNGLGQTLLNSGTFTASGLFTSSNLVLGGTATMAGDQSLGGTFTWTSGNFNNGNTTTISAGATLQLSSTDDHDFSSHVFVNNGTVKWLAGRMRSGFGGSFTNNALFIDSASSEFNNDYQSTVWTFTNASTGTFSKIGAGTTNINVPFVNAGTVSVANGTLSLNGGGTISAGATFNGVGQTLLNNGTFTASGLFTSSNLVLGGSAALAGDQSLGGTFTWTSGNFNNGNTTTIPVGGTLAIATGADHDFSSHNFINNGTINWTAGRLRSGFGGSFTNNAIFNDTASSEFNNDYQSTVWTFTNASTGTYFKSAPGTTDFKIPFINAGTVNVTNGTLQFDGGGTFTNGAQFIGPGQALLASGDYATSGTIHSLNLVLGGTASLSGSSSLDGLFTWTSGNFNNGSTTTIPVGATFAIGGGSDHDFSSHNFINNGTVNWTSGRLRSGFGGSIINAGTWNDSAGSDLNNDYQSTTWTFTNNNTYLKTGGGTTNFQVPFINNNGVILVSGGTLRFSSSFQQNSGTVAVANGASLQFDNGFALAAGILTGTGTVVGDVSSYGLISPGTTTGTLNITGNLTLMSTSALLFELGGTTQGAGYDFLSVGGAATLDGTLSLKFTNGFATTISPTDTFTILNASSRTGNFTNVATSGTRLFTIDGAGSFQVNYTATSVTLSNFVAIPEPSTYALMVTGLAVLALAIGRGRRPRRPAAH